MKVWAMIEKVKDYAWPKSARHFVGMPIEYEYKEVDVGIAALQDERVMVDGRPAYAWWNEIQMLRARESKLQEMEAQLRKQYQILGIAKWARAKDILSDDLFIRVKIDRLLMERNPESALANHPEKFCELEGK